MPSYTLTDSPHLALCLCVVCVFRVASLPAKPLVRISESFLSAPTVQHEPRRSATSVIDVAHPRVVKDMTSFSSVPQSIAHPYTILPPLPPAHLLMHIDRFGGLKSVVYPQPQV